VIDPHRSIQIRVKQFRKNQPAERHADGKTDNENNTMTPFEDPSFFFGFPSGARPFASWFEVLI
jgi:hypothetical protein